MHRSGEGQVVDLASCRCEAARGDTDVLSRWPIGVAATVVGLVAALWRGRYLYRLIGAGRPDPARHPTFTRRARSEVVEVLGQRRLLRWGLPGLAHAAVFWGFLVLLTTVVEAYGALFDPDFAWPGFGRSPILGFLEDLFSLLVVVGLAVFLAIRLARRPARIGRSSRFYGSHTVVGYALLGMIFLVIATLLLFRGAADASGNLPDAGGAFVSRAIGYLLHGAGRGVAGTLTTVALDANVIVIAAFLALLPFTKHLHIALAPINVAYRRERPLGALNSTPDLDPAHFDDDTLLGVGKVTELTWKQLLDLATCTECGRCQSVCPAWASGKALSPKLFVMDLRDELFRSSRPPDEDGAALVPGVIAPEVLWACTTCGACVEECPVDIEHVDAIVDLRRHQVMSESDFPSEAEVMLRNVESRGDPFGIGAAARLEWAAGLDFEIEVVTGAIDPAVEYLLWVGCAGAHDARARRSVVATARLLHRAGVRFAVLGPAERCTGDPARRIGNEWLFQEQARQNIETLSGAGVRRIVTTCPHCLNTLGSEYPALGGNFVVRHHSEVLAELVAEGRLPSATSGEGLDNVTYHDPCYLGRHQRIFDSPRSVIDAAGAGLVEMDRARERSFCCGAGGARMWMEEPPAERVNALRVAEARATGAGVIATGCPYCRIMLDDGVQASADNGPLEVVDLAELLLRGIERD